MRFIAVKESGSVDQLEIQEKAIPDLSPREILIQVKAIGVNRADILQRQGFYPPPPGASEILGLEVSGEVVAVHEDTKKWQVGDRVYALLAGGGYSEYVAVHEDLILKVPEGMDYPQAAGIAEVFLTAYQGLFWLGELKEKEVALIHAGASGVGSAAIQLAKAIHARVIVTASSEKKLLACKKFGADAGINYKEQSFSKEIFEFSSNGADLVLDFIGAKYLEDNIQSLNVDGRIVILGLMGGVKAKSCHLGLVLKKRAKIIGSTLRNRNLDYKSQLISEFQNQFGAALNSGQIFPVIDRIFSWEEVASAHSYMEGNHNIGKIILTVS